jgi:hypothetical protein
MSGATSAVAIGGLALSAAGTAASFIGQSNAASAAAGSAAQQQAWGIYQAQVQAQAQSAQAAWERSLAQNQEKYIEEMTPIRQGLEDVAIADAKQRGQVAEAVSRLGTAQTAGAARARLAAQGTDFRGSPANVVGDIAGAGEFEAQTIRANATREAYGHELEKWGIGNEAALAKYDAQNAERVAQAKQDNARPGLVAVNYTSSNIAPYASLLSGASNLAEKWWRFQNNAPGGGRPSTGGGGDLIGPGTGYTY